MDEHYEKGRPTVLATLIPQTDTSEVCRVALLKQLLRTGASSAAPLLRLQMNFSSWSGFEALPGGIDGGVHYTLAARPTANQLFSVSVSPNGLNGSLLKCAP